MVSILATACKPINLGACAEQGLKKALPQRLLRGTIQMAITVLAAQRQGTLVLYGDVCIK
jgi:hypothetical protein